jgi:membrane associated rhomboid family serine protease
MGRMATEPTLPAPPEIEYCYRHPAVETRVHCTRCGRPICPECMVPAPVGYQCPECVAEARKEFRKGPGRRIAVAQAKGVSTTNVLIGILVAVFVVEVAVAGPGSLLSGASTRKLYDMGASAGVFQLPNFTVLPGIATGQDWRLFTSMFLHIGIIHLAFNCYALWIFGTAVEQEFGRLRFLLIYFASGLFASAASYAFGSLGTVGAGASGAIFGLFGAVLAYNYRRRDTAIARARLQQMVFLIVINAVLAFSLGFIDWRAHAGGFVAGVAAGYLAEGWGNLTQRKVILVAGFAGLLLATVALVVWRTANLHATFPQLS